MKIPEKPVVLLSAARGAVVDLQDVKDSGPTQKKERNARVESEISLQSAELAARLREGDLTAAQAMQMIVDSIVSRYVPAEGAGDLKQALLGHLQSDPGLRRLAAALGLDGQALAQLVENAGKEA